MQRLRIIKWPRGLIYSTLYMTFFIGLLESLGAPHAITYLYDIVTLVLVVYLFGSRRSLSEIIRNTTVKMQLILFAFGVLVAAINSVSSVLIIWGLRNNIRFIIFFDACLLYLKERDVERLQSLFFKIEIINFILVLFEYFILGFARDNLGGIFGTGDGVNGILNCFIVIQLVHHFVEWIPKKERMLPLIVSTGMSLIIATLSEIKIFFVELVLVFIIYFVWIMLIEHNYKTVFKYIAIVFIAVIAASYAIQSLVKIYPDMGDFFSIEKILYHATKAEGYTGHGDLNRLSAIRTINSSIFSGSIVKQLFGLGLGATEFAVGHDLLTSAFYSQYQYLHYSYFSLPWMYLETGYIGLFFYVGSFLKIVLDCIKYRHRKDIITVITTTFIITLMTLLFLIYNQSMRTSASYLVYVYLSFFYVVIDDRELIKKSNSQYIILEY